MKNKKLFAFALLLALSPFLITQGCGQMAYGPSGFEATTSASTSASGAGDTSGGDGGGGIGGPVVTPNVTSNPVAVLSAEQILKSMSSVTNTPISNTIRQEYNAVYSSLPFGFDLSLVTAPVLIGVTNLAGQVCSETIAREASMTATSRSFMAAVDFTQPASSVTDTIYVNVVNNFAMAFWGRAPTADEMTVLLQGRSDFMPELSSADATRPVSTTKLMLFACAGMLSSFETYTF